MSRVLLLLVALACLFAVQRTWAKQPDFRLQVVPAIVYKVDDPGNTRTSSFVFDIAVICSANAGRVIWHDRLGGLHHRYDRAA